MGIKVSVKKDENEYNKILELGHKKTMNDWDTVIGMKNGTKKSTT